ncbi:hypothetical protein AJ79_03234 [Helicocarpus griseus UAMH5409]|uniref:Uncharacterized protein n=1 Tax=Helicocarpus griseus UAMH5409 TaxID=1447875 RepID=A0A2B7Y069_9EURO|nr:hypothetical protein AJ79_03234 [Helicocarpus griseus UAMH5409]
MGSLQTERHGTIAGRGRTFLDALQLSPDTIIHESTLSSLYCRNYSKSAFAIFANLPPEAFDQQQDGYSGKVDYLSDLHLLILRMRSRQNEVAATLFQGLMNDKAKESGVCRSLRLLGSSGVKTSSRQKEPDRSWIPPELPTERTTQWPTVFLEVGYSESKEKLKKDMEYWLNASDDVRMSISIDIEKGSGNILVSSWRRGIPTPLRTSSSNPAPQEIQSVKIERGPAGQQPTLTGHDNITVPFRDLMLRDPQQEEKDFVITREDLLWMADKVWDSLDYD